MIHFIRQMEAYCQLEVIECSWKILLEFIQKREGDLDALIEAHGATFWCAGVLHGMDQKH